MDTEPLVSVITIFLNGDQFIAEAIESVLAQTYSNWEFLLVDDGSTDRATAIAKDFAARFPGKIRYLEHEAHANRGMSASRNLGLEHARGEYISYLDADDVWRPDKLADQAELLQQYPESAYVYGPLELWRSWTGRPSDIDEIQSLGLGANRVVQPPELLNLFLRNEKNIPSGIMIRSEVLERVGRYDEAFIGMYEDLVVHAKICLAQPVYACAKSWYRYRQHPDSCNAKAWRTGRDRETLFAFLCWLESHLIETGAAQGEVWETLQKRLAPFRRPLWRRLPEISRHQSARAQRLGRKIRRKTQFALSPPPIVLCYHRIFEPESDPHLLSVSPDYFRQQLQVIKRIAHPLSLDQLGEAVGRRNLPRRGVIITFDDGYLDNLENALPILREVGLPATIYIATGYVETDREFWWDDLERLTLGPTNLPRILRLQVNNRIREWDLDDELANDRQWNVLATGKKNARQRLFCDLHAALRPLVEPLQQEVLDQLRRLNGTVREARPFYRCMTRSELETLAADSLITLGAHTVTHCDLDYRNREEQQAEIAGSKQELTKLIGRSVEHFSYPYGSFNDESVALCQQNNFRSAVTCIEEPVNQKSHPYRLPRFLVRNWSGAEFERQLERYFRG